MTAAGKLRQYLACKRLLDEGIDQDSIYISRFIGQSETGHCMNAGHFVLRQTYHRPKLTLAVTRSVVHST